MFRILARRLCAITLANGTKLTGEINPNKREQLLKGTAILPDGRVFNGTFDAARGFPLPGSRLEEDGDLYQGQFNARWQRHGVGEAWLADGTHYKGVFKEDELAEGEVRIPNGASEIIFNGTLRDESFVRGTLREHDFTYTGEFANNQPHGRGKLVFSTGAEQEGTFYAGKLHGVSCKMRLEGGFVYVGEFMDGRIQSGTLYTPTYTYDGQFNEHGRAHGEGHQTYLNNEPRLTFSGIWNNGAMVRGSCTDEYGTPVDWQDNHELQSSVLGGTEGDGGEQVAMNAFCSSKLKEADQLHHSMNQSYLRDAADVAAQTGVYPTKMDLGYEGSIRQENARVAEMSRTQLEDMERSRAALADRAKEFDSVVKGVDGNVVGEINENMAKLHFSRQVGAQQLSAHRVDEQFDRFMRSFETQTPSSKAAPSAGDNPTAPAKRLEIDSNAPWKRFTSKA